ncbi:MAG: cadherin-like beta sandwich domain-containing protein [Oscillospiraceae bacterium]|nr:cadherin-like beta sandwich domain-containing protein [Oscillospiraceae bacterium]
MKLSELMENINPSASFEGFVTADDMVLAIDTTAEQNAEVDDYAVVQVGIEGVDPSLNSETKDKQYVRSGKSSTKTATQRQFGISGDMYIGDEAQDFMLSHRIKYGTGQTVIVNYVFFNMLTGKGEKGKATVAVNSDGSGNSGDNAGIDIQLSKVGEAPAEYTYSSESKNTLLASISGLTLSPAFNSRVLNYEAETANESDTITATAVDSVNADVTILMNGTEQTGAITWSPGNNMVTIVVTNGDTSPTVYTIKVAKTT